MVARWVLLLAFAACTPFGAGAEARGTDVGDAGSADASTADASTADASAGATEGVLAFWDFDENGGTVVHDRVSPPLDLTIEAADAVTWKTGALVVGSATTIASSVAATKIGDAVRLSNALTVEAWVRPATPDQSGPARIVGMGYGPSERDFTLGQELGQYVFRLRTQDCDGTGSGELATPANTVRTAVSHVVFTRSETGRRAFYVDGSQLAEDWAMTAPLSTWSSGYKLTLANEQEAPRPWLGELHLVALYARALTAAEVVARFRAGPDRTTP